MYIQFSISQYVKIITNIKCKKIALVRNLIENDKHNISKAYKTNPTKSISSAYIYDLNVLIKVPIVTEVRYRDDVDIRNMHV